MTDQKTRTALIDLDGVAAVWLPAFESVLLDLDPDTTVIDPSAYDVFDRFSSSRDHIKAALNRPGFYRDLAPMPGRKTTIAEMQDEGIEVFSHPCPLLQIQPELGEDRAVMSRLVHRRRSAETSRGSLWDCSGASSEAAAQLRPALHAAQQ